MNYKCLLLSNNQNSHENNENNADNSGDSIGNRMTASKSQPDISFSSVFKASMLIAGTTVGGGFLALPQTVVVPLGGLTVSMASLFGVWAFFLVQSLVLVDCVLECKKNVTKTNQVDSSDSIGIPILATYALGEKGAAFAATLLIILTEATIVSQISRAGSLVAGFGPASTLRQYRIGCIVATLVGAGLSFGGDVKPRKDKQEKDYQGDNNLKRAAEQTIDESSKTITGSNRTFAANANAILTVIFLLSAALLF